jgi:hypothetical protein
MPGPAKAEINEGGCVGGSGTGMPGPAKAEINEGGCVGGSGTGMPGPEATATLVETVKMAARIANCNLKLFEVM